MPSLRLLIFAFLAVVAMSAVPLLVKSTAANEVTIGIARLVVAVAVFTPVFLFNVKTTRVMGKKDWLMLLIIGGAFAGHWITYFISIKQSTAAIAAMALSTYGVQYLVLARVFNGERFTLIEWLAVFVCFSGCVVIAPSLSFDNGITRGIFIGMLSGLIYASVPLLHQRCQHLSTTTRTWGQFFFALLFFLPFLPMSRWDLGGTDYGMLLTLGLLCTVIGHGLWVKSSTELPAIYTGMMYYLYVPIALVASAVFLDEALTPRKLIGAVLILTASTGVTYFRYRRLKIASY